MVKLREEASVLTWADLTDEQKHAGVQLHQLIKQMVESKEEVDTPTSSFWPRIDRKRSNRVVLIDGGRGSGKTALLITLLDLWRHAALGELPKDRDQELKSWAEPVGSIIPVGLLDLHPLPPSTHLLLHMIGRFERVVEWLEGDSRAERRPAAWQFQGADGELESRTRWQNLLRAVAAGWDGNAEARWSRLDLGAYTVELEETERQRLNLVDTFASFIDALVDDFKRWRGGRDQRPPLFVLAVDDADMSLARSIELLDNVRMLWHPRVAFLLTGDSELFMYKLAEHCRRQLRKPFGRPQEDARDAADALATGQLPNDIYDKVIPFGHRCTIPPIPPSARVARLQILAQIQVDPDLERSGANLVSYFQREPQLAELLPDRLRGLIDLRERLETLTLELEGAPRDGVHRRIRGPASRFVESIWRHAVDTSGAPASQFRDMVYVDDDTGALHIRYTEPELGVHRPSPRVVASLASSETGPEFAILQARWLDVMHEGKPLPRLVTAALMLASDVAADQKRGRWDSMATDLTGYEELFASSTYRSERGSEGIRFVWPVPPGYPFSFYAAFHSRWKEETKFLTDRGLGELLRTDVDEAAKRFLRLVMNLVNTNSDRGNLNEVELTWRALAVVVKQFIDQGRTRSRRWALRRAGLFAAPEFGLSPDAANQWLAELCRIVPNDILIENLCGERRATLPDLAHHTSPEKVLRHIDVESPRYDWASVIERDRPLARPPTPGGVVRQD